MARRKRQLKEPPKEALKKFRCYARVVGSKFLGVVEAKDASEASQKAWDLDSACVIVCCQCAREFKDPEVDDIHVEVEEDG